ncbi:hypothetical protein AAY80_249 [Stenotrophomonas phage vB_SmaS-DLP_6]|nr:hypothetical protein AAY80_249 [Stenotrophomonas phage vB_SmaS-DLP_6]
MIFHILSLLFFCLGLMVGFPYAMVWALFYTDKVETDEDRLFRDFLRGKLQLAAILLIAGAVCALITMHNGA